MTVYTNSAGVELEVQRSLNPSENFVLFAQTINHDQLVTIGKPFEQRCRLLLIERKAPLDALLGVVVATPCLLYTSPSPRDRQKSRMPSSA